MRSRVSQAGLLLLGALCVGCGHDDGGTANGREFYFPADSDFQSAQLALSVSMQGAPRRAYVDNTSKTVVVSLRTGGGRPVLQREYRVVAGDLDCIVNWSSADDVDVVFYEYVGSVPETPSLVLALKLASQRDRGWRVEARRPSRPPSAVHGRDLPAWALSQLAASLEDDDKRQIVMLSLPLSPAAEKAVRLATQRVAQEHSLTARAIPPSDSETLTQFSRAGLFLSAVRYDSLNELQITIEDWGKRDLSAAVRDGFRQLPTTQTRRIVGASVVLAGRRPEIVLKAVHEIAIAHGLTNEKDPPEAYLALYRATGLTVRASRLRSPDRVAVSIEDVDSREKALRVEQALRDALGQLSR